MRFRQLDQITLLEPGKRIEGNKSLDGKEDYLRDHFPRFAVMPGVMMLESLYQAAAMLVRSTDDFKAGLVLLRQAKNVKFADFVQPGQTLQIDAEIVKRDGGRFTIKARGHKDGKLAVAGRLVVESVVSETPTPIEQFAANYMRQLAGQLQGAAMAPSFTKL